MGPADTKTLRIEYNNKWPARFPFPLESQFAALLAEKNVVVPFKPAPLAPSDDAGFHRILASILDALDALPLRPDRAFEALWTAIDAEAFRVFDTGKKNTSRFVQLLAQIESQPDGAAAWSALAKFVELAPLHSCEYVARRIFDALNDPDKHSPNFLAKIKPSVGIDFFNAFAEKYNKLWVDEKASRPATQRKAGALFQLVLKGREVELGNNRYKLNETQRISLIASAVLPNVRNEKFHGDSFPSYRSSAAKLKTYAGGYFFMEVAYYLILNVFVYRDFNSIDLRAIKGNIEDNCILYQNVFGKFARD
jgi:hypothetical protein